MLRGFLTNSSGILFSRIAGFVRDLTMSSVLGVGIFSDMFLIAFRIPNAFRRIFAEGAFAQAFLPSFSAARHKGAFTLHIGFSFLLVILLLCLCVVAFAPYVARALAIGLEPNEVLIVAELVAINFWYLPLIFVITLLGSLLQYKHNFAAAAYSTALLNLAMIAALLLTRESDPFTIVMWCDRRFPPCPSATTAKRSCRELRVATLSPVRASTKRGFSVPARSAATSWLATKR